jgi:DNA gyrase subunit A
MGSGTKPQRFTLRDSLDCFLDFRFETIRRKSAFQLRKVESRAHIVDGLLAALTCVDEVIEMIRSAPDQNAAREALMDEANEALGLSREQADAVLRLQLGQLTRLNKGKLEEEKVTLESSQKELNTLMTKDEAVLDVMHDEFEDFKKKFGTDRKTQIEVEEKDLSEMDLIRNSRSVIVVTRGGYIKRMPLKTFESQGRGTRGKKGTSDPSEENEVAHCFTCNDHDSLLMVTRKGIAFGLRAFQVPTGGRTAKGTPIPSVLPVTSDDTVTTILPVSFFSNDEFIVLATKHGWIKKTPLKAFENLSIRGKTIATLDDGDSLNWAHKCTDSDDILIGTTEGKAGRFEAAKLRPTGRTSRGVRAMRLRDGDTVADMNVLNTRGSGSAQKSKNDAEYVLAVTSQGYGKRVPTSEFRTTARGGLGVIAIKFKGNTDNDSVSCLRVVREDDEILLITSKGIMVRQQVKDISSQSRSATGVLVQKVDVDNGDYISSVSIVPKYEERDE